MFCVAQTRLPQLCVSRLASFFDTPPPQRHISIRDRRASMALSQPDQDLTVIVSTVNYPLKIVLHRSKKGL
jgi:hypothetical protein